MSSELVERVARALYDDLHFVKPWDHPDSVRICHAPMLREARAAIEAMREPTEAMLAPFQNDQFIDRDPDFYWRMMIDEALK